MSKVSQQIEDRSPETSHAFRQGYDAFLGNASRKSNPNSGEDADEWDRGWDCARSCFEDETGRCH